MKKVSLFIVAALFAVSAGFVSCSDEDVDPATISFDNVTNDQYTLAEGVTSYTVNATITSTENLKTVKVTKTVGSVGSQVGSTITSFPNKTSYHLSQVVNDITEDCKITVTVDNGTESTRTLTIKYTAAPETPAAGKITTSTAVIMAAQDNAAAGSYATSTNKTYKSSEAVANSSTIDFIYYYQAGGDLAELFSPNSSKASTLNNYKDMTPKRDTKFKKVTMDETTFNAITDDATIVETATSLTASEVTNLVVGDVVAFKTADSKLGLFRVTALTATTSGTITITVKVQE